MKHCPAFGGVLSTSLWRQRKCFIHFKNSSLSYFMVTSLTRVICPRWLELTSSTKNLVLSAVAIMEVKQIMVKFPQVSECQLRSASLRAAAAIKGSSEIVFICLKFTWDLTAALQHLSCWRLLKYFWRKSLESWHSIFAWRYSCSFGCVIPGCFF